MLTGANGSKSVMVKFWELSGRMCHWIWREKYTLHMWGNVIIYGGETPVINIKLSDPWCKDEKNGSEHAVMNELRFAERKSEQWITENENSNGYCEEKQDKTAGPCAEKINLDILSLTNFRVTYGHLASNKN